MDRATVRGGNSTPLTLTKMNSGGENLRNIHARRCEPVPLFLVNIHIETGLIFAVQRAAPPAGLFSPAHSLDSMFRAFSTWVYGSGKADSVSQAESAYVNAANPK
ncbi:hypothetical protein [Methylomagnum sp.]